MENPQNQRRFEWENHLFRLGPWLPWRTVSHNQRVYIWVNYNDLTTTSLEIMVSKGNHPQMALIQVSEIL